MYVLLKFVGLVLVSECVCLSKMVMVMSVRSFCDSWLICEFVGKISLFYG